MLNWLLSAILMAVPTGELAIKSGDLEVTMTSAAGWTITAASFQGEKMILPLGGQGAVISSGGKWIGSAMSKDEPEPVSDFNLTADAVKQEGNKLTAGGDKIVVSKNSMLSTLKHHAETTFGNGFIIQHHQFEATEDLTVTQFYAFIYSLTPQAKNWLAQPVQGDMLRGGFTGDGSQKPTRPLLWLAQYDPATQKGIIAYFQQPLAAPGYVTLWDRKEYHKLFAQPMSGTIARGTKLDLTMVMQFFAATPAEWENQATTLVANLKTRFPQAVTQAPEQPRRYDAGVPEHGLMTLKTTHFTVPMSADQAWTIQQILYNDQQIAHEKGFYGTVMIPKGSNFWGTGHTEGGAEIVHSVKLTADGKDVPVKIDETASGKQLTLQKTSTIWKFKCDSEVTVLDDQIVERTQLEATEDVELKLLYYFMHCFVPTTTKWAALLPDSNFAEGELDSKEGEGVQTFEVNRDTQWVAQYEPERQIALLCYTPKVISGPGSAAKIWDLGPNRYHKFYYQQNRGQTFKQGEKLDYTVIVKVVPNETGDWAATKVAVEDLMKQYPPVK